MHLINFSTAGRHSTYHRVVLPLVSAFPWLANLVDFERSRLNRPCSAPARTRRLIGPQLVTSFNIGDLIGRETDKVKSMRASLVQDSWFVLSIINLASKTLTQCKLESVQTL